MRRRMRVPTPSTACLFPTSLLRLFVDRVLVALGAVLLQLDLPFLLGLSRRPVVAGFALRTRERYRDPVGHSEPSGEELAEAKVSRKLSCRGLAFLA